MSTVPKGKQRAAENEKEWLDLLYHENKTIKRPDQVKKQLRHPPSESLDQQELNRVHGSMIGMAIGDALGAHVEFRPQEYMENNPVKDMKGGGTWGLQKGQFTDDTSMALCLGNSLVHCQDFNPYDQLVRYKWWYKKGYMSSTGECFDIGAATRQSLDVFTNRQKQFAKKHGIAESDMDFLKDPELLRQFDVQCSEMGVAGNGALMRLAPVPLFFYRHPEQAVAFSGISGIITHGDDRAYDACRYYGALIVAALQGAEKSELLDEDFYQIHKPWFNSKPLHKDIEDIARGSYKKKQKGYSAGIRGKGYIVQALEAALWSFCYDGDSFEKGALAAVNLGDDTDTTAAIYGQLAGAHYGYTKLPEKWRDLIYARDFISCLSRWIVHEGKAWQPSKSMAPTSSSDAEEQQNDDNLNSASHGTSPPAADKETMQPASSQTSKAPPEKQSKSKKHSNETGTKKSKIEQGGNETPFSASKKSDTPATADGERLDSDKNQNAETVSKHQKKTETKVDNDSKTESKQSKANATTDKKVSDPKKKKESRALLPENRQKNTEPKPDKEAVATPASKPKNSATTSQMKKSDAVDSDDSDAETTSNYTSTDVTPCASGTHKHTAKCLSPHKSAFAWLDSLGSQYTEYADAFKTPKFTVSQLLNIVKPSDLKNFGIKTKKDQIFFFERINEIRNRCSQSTPNNKE